MSKKRLAIVIIFFIISIFEFFQLKLFCQNDELPSWIKDLIIKQEKGPVANPPAYLSRCVYKNKIVYYLPPRCCDIPSVLYDESGNYICSPDGGFTGRGDEKCIDFYKEKKNCEIVWKDSRSFPPHILSTDTLLNAGNAPNKIKH